MKINKNIAVSESGFIFNASRGDSFSTNPIAKEILNLIKGGTPQEEIKEYILNTYEVDSDTVEKDLYDFITILEQNNLIEQDEQA